jgi:hypothetical protein
MSDRKQIVWTDQTDLALRILHENGWTLSGIALRLECSRDEVVARAESFGLRLYAGSNARSKVLQARQGDRA